MQLEITIVLNNQGLWVATYAANIPNPAVAVGASPQAAMAALVPAINYEDIPNE